VSCALSAHPCGVTIKKKGFSLVPCPQLHDEHIIKRDRQKCQLQQPEPCYA